MSTEPIKEAVAFKDFLPLLNIFAGGILATLSGFVSNWYIESRKENRLRKNLAFAFQGEISAIVEIVKRRKYIEGIKNALQKTESSRSPYKYLFRARKSYFSVFEANVGQIGTMCAPLSNLVAKFYIQAKSILEDMEQIEAIDLSTVDAIDRLLKIYNELLPLFEDTQELGQKIVAEVSRQYH